MSRNNEIKIDGKLDISIREESVIIRLHDHDAVTQPVEIEVKHKDFIAALGRLGHVSCTASFADLDTVGKKREHKPFRFEIPKDWCWQCSKYKKELIKRAFDLRPDGWEISTYFESQGSFIEEDGKTFACTHIMRWVEKDNKEADDGK